MKYGVSRWYFKENIITILIFFNYNIIINICKQRPGIPGLNNARTDTWDCCRE